jgi:GT2 family glycosyltransferase
MAKKTPENPLVSVVIVNWNGLKWLKGCLPGLKKQTYKKIEIIVVDNSSADGSVRWMRDNFPEIRIITNSENLGFSHANNIGYQASKGSYVLFLNNDTRVTGNFISELVKTLDSSSDIGGAQSKILLMDKPDTLDSIGAFLTPTGFLYHYRFMEKDKPEYDKQIDLYTVKGACMMFKRGVLKKVEIDSNIFDPDYFAYFEETDLCHRIWLTGHRIVYAPRSVIYHKMGATSGGMDNSFVQYHSFKNRIRTYLKDLGAGGLFVILPLHLAACEAFSVIALIKGNLPLFLMIHRAIFWNLFNLGNTLKLRRKIQPKRTMGDGVLSRFILCNPPLWYYVTTAGRFV